MDKLTDEQRAVLTASELSLLGKGLAAPPPTERYLLAALADERIARRKAELMVAQMMVHAAEIVRERDALAADNARLRDQCESAWGLIANAGGGDWATQSAEWVQAARRWRDAYHAILATQPAGTD